MIDNLLKAVQLSDLESFKYGSNDRNKILKWYATDKKEIYKKNLKEETSRTLLEKCNWLDSENDITYEFDDCGFRIESNYDIKSDKSLLVVGCSISFGVGLKAEQTWPWLLGKKLNYNVFNRAVVGSGLSGMFMKLMYWLPKINPDFVICFAPEFILNRVDMFKLGGEIVESYLPDHLGTKPGEHRENLTFSTKLQQELNQYVLDERNVFSTSYKNLIAMKYLTESNGCKFISNWDFNTYDRNESVFWFQNTKNLARDLLHDGVVFQKYITSRFFRKVNR